MNTYVLVSEKPWHDSLFNDLQQVIPTNWVRISSRQEFEPALLEKLKPAKIFIPHWSYIIPAEIYNNYECIVFHMTDLPFGRGGSPLQNLIVRGCENTKISALRVTDGIDTGDIYLKQDLSLAGSAKEIFIRASDVIRNMIIDIVEKKPEPKPQSGEITLFKRRKPADGDISSLTELNAVYDFIRMLDCEGYPPAFLETAGFRLEFTNAILQPGQTIDAHVRITKK